MNVKKIIVEYLKAHGYDGLVDTSRGCGCGNCGCLASDLAPCGDINPNCRPGYSGPDLSGEFDYYIYLTRKAAEAAREK